MIKYALFDLDGVLVDARELHYQALNRALEEYGFTINRTEHLSTYDGLTTKQKLKMLTERKGLPVDLYDDIWRKKQEATIKIINTYTYDDRMRGILKQLRLDGLRIAVVSNSISETIKMMLLRKGLMEYVDFYLSNEETIKPKPHPEIYLRAILKFSAEPKECVAIEDSHHGRAAANAAGVFVCGVRNTDDVSYEKITQTIKHANYKEQSHQNIPKWQGGNLRIVIPMAGEGHSYIKAGYTFPKHLVEIRNKPMIQWVVENINAEAKFIFVVKKDHLECYNLKYLLQLIAPGCEIVPLEQNTHGAAESVLAAEKYFNDDNPLAIINCDQYMEWNSNEFFYAMSADECDGGIVTFESTHPKWSFARTGEDGYVEEVAEKKPISNRATAGVYYFKHGNDFIKYARQMIDRKITTNNEFFVCPVYNELIKDNKKIRAFPLKKVWSFATPEDLREFLQYQANPQKSDSSKNERPAPSKQRTELVEPMQAHIIPHNKTTIVIPMAGEGRRFWEAGYTVPKPFIDVLGVPMIEHVLQNLHLPGAEFILIARKDHFLTQKHVIEMLKNKYHCTVVFTDKLTEGAACTVLLASGHINNEQPLLMANSDQLVDIKLSDYIGDAVRRNLDGSILTFYTDDPKWSYAKVDESGKLTEVKEKQVISNHATVGLYYYKHGHDFVTSAAEMIACGDRTNNEFYVAPAYNYMVRRGANIGIYEISESQMHGLGTPDDLRQYLSLKNATRV